jgi:hypothetical protein
MYTDGHFEKVRRVDSRQAPSSALCNGVTRPNSSLPPERVVAHRPILLTRIVAKYRYGINKFP